MGRRYRDGDHAWWRVPRGEVGNERGPGGRENQGELGGEGKDGSLLLGESDDEVRARVEGSDEGLRGDILSESWEGSEKWVFQRGKVSHFVSGAKRIIWLKP